METIDISFLSKEQDFIHNFGVNRGYSLSYSKVDRCLFLSSDAKQLYRNICSYAYGDKRNCFPSQQSLKLELGWGNDKFNNVLDELRDFGLIITENRRGHSLIYKIVELNKVPVLIHSEIIYTVREQCSDFFSKLREYKSTELYSLANKEPLKYREQIIQWFSNHVTQREDSCTKRLLPKVIDESLEVDISKETVQKKKVGVDSPVDEWNFHTFIKYYDSLYKKKYLKPYLVLKADLKQLSNLLKIKDNETIKEYMELFIDLEFFDTKTIKAFCSNYTQTALDYYTKTGKLPNTSYKKESKSEPETLDDWANEVDNIFGGEGVGSV